MIHMIMLGNVCQLIPKQCFFFLFFFYSYHKNVLKALIAVCWCNEDAFLPSFTEWHCHKRPYQIKNALLRNRGKYFWLQGCTPYCCAFFPLRSYLFMLAGYIDDGLMLAARVIKMTNGLISNTNLINLCSSA